MERIIIAAVAENGVIGNEGEIPWHYPADFQHFKETTTGHPVIMGRTTYESLPEQYRPLPDRTNIVLSFEEMDVPDTVVNVHSIKEALDVAASEDETVYVAGGATVYQQFLEKGLADRMIITHIPETPDGDTYFPDWDPNDWKTVEEWEDGELRFTVYNHVTSNQ